MDVSPCILSPAIPVPVQRAGPGGASRTPPERPIWRKEALAPGRALLAFRMVDDSMKGGVTPIESGDLVVLDRLESPRHGVVLVRLREGTVLCRQLLWTADGALQLLVSTAMATAEPDLRVSERDRVAEVLGRVVRVIHDPT